MKTAFLIGILLALASGVSGGDQGVDYRIKLSGDFITFGLCMSNLSAADQVLLCQKLGYPGLDLGGFNSDILKALNKIPAVIQREFRIYSALWWFTYNKVVDLTWLDAILSDAAKLDMAVWIVADWDGKVDRNQAILDTLNNFEIIAERCRAKGVQLVLYPHVGCVFETAEQALEIQQRLAARGYPEVRISIHLCHELKRNNAARLNDIIAKVAPYLSLVSISGANANTFGDGAKDYWSTAIMPLDEGTYDLRPFLQVLSDNHYRGPIELHTYALKQPNQADYDQHLERSLVRWRELVAKP